MDLTVVAIPSYFGGMGAEYWWLRRHAAERGATPADYEWRDTAANLAMGVGSLLLPVAADKLLRRLAPVRRGVTVGLLAAAAAGAAAATIGERVARRLENEDVVSPEPSEGVEAPEPSEPRAARRRRIRMARRVASVGGVAAIGGAGAVATTAWNMATTPERLFGRRVVGDLGNGPLVLAAAILGWDFIYYWNHRFMHESRYMWAIHSVHHSSEGYNLSTALRQPVAEIFGTFVPTGLLSLLGIRPDLVATARGVNLLYQFWIHTDVVRRLGPLESVLNTPSHHRVHHGSNRRYLDRNHGSILIVWDRLFGTFEPEDEDEPVVYGLTKNIHTNDPLRIAAHEYGEMAEDVARSRTWRDRISYVVRGPGWAYERREAQVV